MPQIWMTYDEVADLLGCDAEQAYERGLQERLDCKISRDGQRRVRLNPTLVGFFLDRVRAQPNPIDGAIDELRRVHGLMTGYDPQPDLREKPAAQRKFGRAW
jgi:hypothetical protein